MRQFIKKFKKIIEAANVCYYCEREFNNKINHLNAGRKTVDHIIPLCWGGRNVKDNVVISCDWCNNEKNDKTLENFIEHIEILKTTLPQSIKSYINLSTIQVNTQKLISES